MTNLMKTSTWHTQLNLTSQHLPETARLSTGGGWGSERERPARGHEGAEPRSCSAPAWHSLATAFGNRVGAGELLGQREAPGGEHGLLPPSNTSRSWNAHPPRSSPRLILPGCPGRKRTTHTQESKAGEVTVSGHKAHGRYGYNPGVPDFTLHTQRIIWLSS